MESLSKKPTKKTPAILILADFSDGSRHAIFFWIQFLYTLKLPIFILQTFQNPNFGQSMLSDIFPRFKKITKQELKSLKITAICAKINYELDILFVVENESQKMNKEV